MFSSAQTNFSDSNLCLKDTYKLTIKREHIHFHAHQLPVLCKTESLSRINTLIITLASLF